MRTAELAHQVGAVFFHCLRAHAEEFGGSRGWLRPSAKPTAGCSRSRDRQSAQAVLFRIRGQVACIEVTLDEQRRHIGAAICLAPRDAVTGLLNSSFEGWRLSGHNHRRRPCSDSRTEARSSRCRSARSGCTSWQAALDLCRGLQAVHAEATGRPSAPGRADWRCALYSASLAIARFRDHVEDRPASRATTQALAQQAAVVHRAESVSAWT